MFLTFILSLISCGPPGSTGPSGSNGTNGNSCTVSSITSPQVGSLITCTDGTSSLVLSGSVVQAVQFCPNQTSYPGTFSEVGFCIQGVLYAVYSLNNGFMSQIPSGQYSSNGVNSSCNFTVVGCTVTQN